MLMHVYGCIDMKFMMNVNYMCVCVYIYIYIYNYPCVENVVCNSHLHVTCYSMK